MHTHHHLPARRCRAVSQCLITPTAAAARLRHTRSVSLPRASQLTAAQHNAQLYTTTTVAVHIDTCANASLLLTVHLYHRRRERLPLPSINQLRDNTRATRLSPESITQLLLSHCAQHNASSVYVVLERYSLYSSTVLTSDQWRCGSQSYRQRVASIYVLVIGS